MTDSIINIGVIGCANIATRSVIPAILELPNHFNLLGVASRTLEKARACAGLFNTQAYEGYQNLLDQPGLNSVYIPLPNSLHTEWVEKALLKGLNVLVEKPLACKIEDVKKLNQIAKEKRLLLMENFQFRFHSQLHYIRNMLKEGKIGDVRCLRSSFGFPGLRDPNDIRYKRELDGGALLDTGAYPLKIAQIFMGQDIEVRAANLNYLPDYEVDMWGGCYVKQRTGTQFGELAFGFDHHYQCNLELWGATGKIYTNRVFTAPKNHVSIIELETRSGKETITLPADHHFRNMLNHFYELVVTKKMEDLDLEYAQNFNQARLVNEIKIKANE